MENLPIWQYREEIVSMVRENDILILTGETGSGKTTVVPYLLAKAGYSCIVTQPRRLAAESVATFLAKAQGEEVGKTIGFWHSMRKAYSQETQILFCTDGLEVVLEILSK